MIPVFMALCADLTMLFKVKLSKDRKKGDKIVSDSQERAYWRIHRPPPGFTSSLEPVPVCNRGGTCSKKRRSSQDLRKEVGVATSCFLCI